MNKTLALLAALLLLPFGAATPQTYAPPALAYASGFVTPGTSSGFIGVQIGTGPCNGINSTYGSYTASGNSMMSTAGMDCIMSLGASYDLKVGLNGARPQNWFSYIRVVNCDGNVVIYTSASATYATSGSDRTWTWGTGSTPVFELPCTGTTAQVIFFR